MKTNKKTEHKDLEKEKEKNIKSMSYEGEFIGINIRSFKTVYSLFSNINKNYFKKVLESNNFKKNFSSKYVIQIHADYLVYKNF